MLKLKDIKRILKKRLKLIVLISIVIMIVSATMGLKSPKKEVETKVAILVDKSITKEELDKSNYDYLRFINAKSIAGPTELAKSQKIMKKVTSSVDIEYDFKQASKILTVTNNLDANLIYIGIRGNNVDKVNKMLDVYTEEFLNEARTIYSDTQFIVLDKENVEQIEETRYVKSIMVSILGAVLGLFISIIIAVILDILDSTVKDEEELENLGLNVLVVIPNHNQ